MPRTAVIGRPTTHGHSSKKRTSTYITWESLKRRCKFDPQYVNVTYDPAWESFEIFLRDMGERPIGTSLDRIDNSEGYNRKNCRWATARQQQNNRTNNVRLNYKGESLTLPQWSQKLGLPRQTLYDRYRRGWDVTRIIETPKRRYPSGKS